MIHFLIKTLFLITFLFFISANAAQFTVTNNCSYTVWAAAIPAAGGKELLPATSWTITATTTTRIWARTGCNSTGPNGLNCTTGDCNGVLQCTSDGSPPRTLAEYAVLDTRELYDISLVDGFNVPMSLSPMSARCRGVTCRGDIVDQCPGPLRATGGCNSPCNVFKTNQYCCNSGVCQPTDYSRYFKALCPDAFSLPSYDQSASTLNCPSGTNYKLVFCP